MSKPATEGLDLDHASETRSSLSEAHQHYLVARHGTVHLDPVPQMDDADPLNWPTSKKVLNLALVASHAMMFSFTAAAIQCAFVDIAADLHVSVQQASYLTSLFIAILGLSSLLWGPLSHAYGRRPVFLVSLLGALVGNVGCAASPSYAAMAVCRAITAVFASPGGSLGGAIVSETFFRKQRARCMGVWTVMMTLGVPVAPLVFGFVALRVGYRCIYWTLAITNGVHVILYFLLASETRYEPAATHTKTQRYFGCGRIDSTPLRCIDFVRPLTLVTRVCVAAAAAAYAMVFLWASIMTTLMIPQIFPAQFGLNTQQVGLQNIAIIIGTLLGEQLGGFASDKWMWQRERRGQTPAFEFRLWLCHVGYMLAICGIAVFFVQLDRPPGRWTVTPVVGAGIAAAGNQVVTTVMVTYAVDCYPQDAASIGVFVTFVRQTWGFIGPFWFPQMITGLGYRRSTAVSTAMMMGVSVLPTMLLQWKGRSWRKSEALRRMDTES